MPAIYNTNETLPDLPDGLPADAVYYNGVLVAQAEVPIDVFDRSNLGYYVGDTGATTSPQIVSGGYDNPNALWCPPGVTNDVTNLSDTNPGYNSSNQDIVLENYLQPGDIAEVYFNPTGFTDPAQFRFSFFANGYYPSDHIRLRWTEGYWRIEQGSDLYGGTGDAESFTGFSGTGNYHRVVIDCSSFPYIECHLWDAGTGDFISTVSGNGDGWPDDPGHQVWWNGDTEMHVSDFRKIDSDDFTAGQPL